MGGNCDGVSNSPFLFQAVLCGQNGWEEGMVVEGGRPESRDHRKLPLLRLINLPLPINILHVLCEPLNKTNGKLCAVKFESRSKIGLLSTTYKAVPKYNNTQTRRSRNNLRNRFEVMNVL